jgi:predicted HAD superfamily phosphohydrolase
MAEQVLVVITVSRKRDEILYKVDCAKEIKSEELAHYLDEIIEGICTWKPEVCTETVQSIVGTIKDSRQ